MSAHGLRFTKAHAYGNDFLYVEARLVLEAARVELARAMCDRHTGVGADGLIYYATKDDEAYMTLINADGSRAEVSGNGVRGLAALVLKDDRRDPATVTIHTEAGAKVVTRSGPRGSHAVFRSSMGAPGGVRQVETQVGDELLSLVVLNMGNPQCVLLGPLPDKSRFSRLGRALEHHPMFPDGTNVEFAQVERPAHVRILIWERGVGPTTSSGTGSCAALVAAAAFGGADRTADVQAPGGIQRVEWLGDGVYLTGSAEMLCHGEWLRQIPRTDSAPSR